MQRDSRTHRGGGQGQKEKQVGTRRPRQEQVSLVSHSGAAPGPWVLCPLLALA
jgi:hypothetical protein